MKFIYKVLIWSSVGTFVFGVLQTVNANDKAEHAAVSGALSAASYMTCRTVLRGDRLPCVLGSAATALAIGVAKEISDGNRNTGSEHAKDIGADVLGTALGLGISFTF